MVYKEWLFLEKLLLSGSKIYGRKLSSYDFSGHLFFQGNGDNSYLFKFKIGKQTSCSLNHLLINCR